MGTELLKWGFPLFTLSFDSIKLSVLQWWSLCVWMSVCMSVCIKMPGHVTKIYIHPST